MTAQRSGMKKGNSFCCFPQIYDCSIGIVDSPSAIVTNIFIIKDHTHIGVIIREGIAIIIIAPGIAVALLAFEAVQAFGMELQELGLRSVIQLQTHGNKTLHRKIVCSRNIFNACKADVQEFQIGTVGQRADVFYLRAEAKLQELDVLMILEGGQIRNDAAGKNRDLQLGHIPDKADVCQFVVMADIQILHIIAILQIINDIVCQSVGQTEHFLVNQAVELAEEKVVSKTRAKKVAKQNATKKAQKSSGNKTSSKQTTTKSKPKQAAKKTTKSSSNYKGTSKTKNIKK